MTESSDQKCRAVLVVEDDSDIRETLRDTLEVEGYTVLTATNGKDAIDTLHHMERPCLILLDLMMPIMNGLEFLAACRKDDALVTIPVVMVTAYESVAQKSSTAAKAILKKPIDLDRLLDFVMDFCGPGAAAPA
jgi:CheY-like chemotaxis protein